MRALTGDETRALLGRYVAARASRRVRLRWLRSLRRDLAVAADAIEQGDRPRAIAVLCGVLHLEHAIAVTAGLPILKLATIDVRVVAGGARAELARIGERLAAVRAELHGGGIAASLSMSWARSVALSPRR